MWKISQYPAAETAEEGSVAASTTLWGHGQYCNEKINAVTICTNHSIETRSSRFSKESSPTGIAWSAFCSIMADRPAE